MIKELGDDIRPTNVQFHDGQFWIRVFNLPIKRMTREVGQRIGRAIGDCIAIDAPANGVAVGPYLRIRVAIDITRPLY